MTANTVILPVDIGVANAASLQAQLIGKRGEPTMIDAGNVDRLGALGLQVLLAAAKTWRDDGVELRIVEASESFRSALRITGVELPGVTQ
jgi:chemotaxis protein CheX